MRGNVMAFENKVVCISGAAKGIGLACAKQFVALGAQVVMCDIDKLEGKKQADLIGADFILLDVSNSDNWQKVEESIQARYGRLDIMVNNAGISGVGMGEQDPEHIKLKNWQLIHQVNLDSVLLGCQMAIRLMKNQGGVIINVSSMSGTFGVSRACAYASSKAAIRNLTKSVALYCAEQQYGIRCNTILPGAIQTPMWDPMFGDEETKNQMIQHIESKIPLGHMGKAEDVANSVVYLASEQAAYINGTEIKLDGGGSAGDFG